MHATYVPTVHQLKWCELCCLLKTGTIRKEDCREVLIPVILGVIDDFDQCSLKGLIEALGQAVGLWMVCRSHSVIGTSESKELFFQFIHELPTLI